MKYVVIVPDGAAEQPLESLGGKSPLEAAQTPEMDRIAQQGVVGQVQYVPDGFPVGSDVALMGLLGADPRQYYRGRAGLEALGLGHSLQDGQWAIRCNLVTLEDGRMRDPTAGAISGEQARALIESANEQLDGTDLKLVSGKGYRNLLIVGGSVGQGFSPDTRMVSPNDVMGQLIADAYPRGPQSELLCQIMDQSVSWFANHSVNQQRRSEGKLPATCLWFWGAGRLPQPFSFRDRYGKSAAMIGAVDLVHGLAEWSGIQRIPVPTATGMPDTDYAAKGQAACRALDDTDLVLIHVEAPDEAAHQQDVDAKVRSIESIDQQIVKPVMHRLATESDWRILITPDHQTWTQTGAHHAGPVCFTASGAGIDADGAESFCERQAETSRLNFSQGWELLPWFLDC